MSQNITENLNLVIFFKMFEIKKSELLILNIFGHFVLSLTWNVNKIDVRHETS